jgi:hypothetical protein
MSDKYKASQARKTVPPHNRHKCEEANLLVLVGEEVDAEGVLLNTSALAAEVKNADLAIGDSAAEARLGVGLVLAVAVATCGTATHCPATCQTKCHSSS